MKDARTARGGRIADGTSRVTRAVRAALTAAAALLALSCADGEGGPTDGGGGVQLTVTPGAVSAQAGGSASVTASVTRSGGFDGVVALAVTGLPAGVGAQVTPAQLAAGETSATVEASVATTVAPGAYTATVTATAGGIAPATATYQLTVTAPPPASRSVEYRFCDPPRAPVFFAYQDGSGTWQAVTGSTSEGVTRFGFGLAQERGGVLMVFRTPAAASPGAAAASAGWPRRAPGHIRRVPPGGGAGHAASRAAGAGSAMADVYQTQVLYGSAAELVQDGIDYCALSRPTRTVTGTVAGVPFGQYGIASLGGSTELFVAGASSNPVTFAGVPTGPVDLVGTRMPRSGTAPDRALILRNLDPPSGGALPATIDFGGPASSAAASATVVVSGGGADELEVFTDLVTANGQGLLWFDLAPSRTATRPWGGLGTAALASGDLHGLIVLATPPVDTVSDYRVALRWVGAVSDQTLALGPLLAAPSVTPVAAGAYPRFRFRGAIPAAYDKGASIEVASPSGPGNLFAVLATAAYLAAAGDRLAYDFTMPDVAGLPGFPAAARLSAGSNEASAGAFGFTGAGAFDQRPSLGSALVAAGGGVRIDVP